MQIVQSGDDAFNSPQMHLLATKSFGSMNIMCIFENVIKQEALCNMFVMMNFSVMHSLIILISVLTLFL